MMQATSFCVHRHRNTHTRTTLVHCTMMFNNHELCECRVWIWICIAWYICRLVVRFRGATSWTNSIRRHRQRYFHSRLIVLPPSSNVPFSNSPLKNEENILSLKGGLTNGTCHLCGGFCVPARCFEIEAKKKKQRVVLLYVSSPSFAADAMQWQPSKQNFHFISRANRATTRRQHWFLPDFICVDGKLNSEWFQVRPLQQLMNLLFEWRQQKKCLENQTVRLMLCKSSTMISGRRTSNRVRYDENFAHIFSTSWRAFDLSEFKSAKKSIHTRGENRTVTGEFMRLMFFFTRDAPADRTNNHFVARVASVCTVHTRRHTCTLHTRTHRRLMVFDWGRWWAHTPNRATAKYRNGMTQGSHSFVCRWSVMNWSLRCFITGGRFTCGYY